MNPRGIGYEGVKLIQLTQDRIEWWSFANTAKHLRFHKVGHLKISSIPLKQSFKKDPTTWPIPMAERSKARTVLDRSNTGTHGFQSRSRHRLCPPFSVLCCPVKVQDLRSADPPSRNPTEMSKWIHSFRS